MSDIAIRVESLSKQYRIGRAQQRHDMLQEAIVGTFQRLASRRSSVLRANDEYIWALKDVSFEVEQGQVLGIIGRNGAGKSTLLKILSRITEPTEGRAMIHGRVGSLLEVGTGFHPDLTGRENIYLNGAILGMKRPEIDRRFDEIVAFAEIEKFLDTPVKRYSSGMYVRLAFAVAAHLEPEILLVDEVLAVGDARFQKKCLGKMGEVAKGGRTVLYVSHNMQSVRRLCSQAMLLDQGVCIGISAVEQAIQRYLEQTPASPLDVEVQHHFRKAGMGEKARLVRLRVAPGTSLCYGQPMGLVFTVQCVREIPDMALGIGFETLEGSRVMTLDSDHNQLPVPLPPGVYEVSFFLDRNPLHPSLYNVHAQIMTGTHALDSVLNVAIWEVGSGAGDLVGDRGYGGCRLPVRVSVTPSAIPASARITGTATDGWRPPYL